MRLVQAAAVSLAVFILASVIANAQAAAPAASTSDSPIKHVVIMMQENHSFDNYFGAFPNTNGNSEVPKPFNRQVHHMHSSTHDLCHQADCSNKFFNGGKMDGWTDYEAFGYYNSAEIPYYWQLARNYTLLDNYFSGFMGPSLPNRVVAVSGWNYQDTNNAATYNGLPLNSTIFDQLNAKSVTWTYYTGYCCTLNGFNPLPLSPHNLKARDVGLFYSDLEANKLSSVTWIMPSSEDVSEHPIYNVTLGMAQVRGYIDAIRGSPFWKSTAVLLTWDESGGFYDHVAPPNATFGFRVPLLIVSPFALHGFIDHKFSSHSSTLAFLESLFHLKCMKRDCHSSNLLEAFSFGKTGAVGRAESPGGTDQPIPFLGLWRPEVLLGISIGPEAARPSPVVSA